LKASKRIPDLPEYLNSPMAVDATGIYAAHEGEHRLPPDQWRAMGRTVHVVGDVYESKRLNTREGPMIIISASGMATGGRVVHHIKAFAPDPKNRYCSRATRFLVRGRGAGRGRAVGQDSRRICSGQRGGRGDEQHFGPRRRR
jgi:metallo-beta-lactamase family protein